MSFWRINEPFLLFPHGRRLWQLPEDVRGPELKTENVPFPSATGTKQKPHPNICCSDVLQTGGGLAPDILKRTFWCMMW